MAVQDKLNEPFVEEHGVTFTVIFHESLVSLFWVLINGFVVAIDVERPEIVLSCSDVALLWDSMKENPADVSNNSCGKVACSEAGKDGGVVAMLGHVRAAHPTD